MSQPVSEDAAQLPLADPEYKEPPVLRDTIVAGLLVSDEEGHAWYKRQYGVDLKNDTSGRFLLEVNIIRRLRPILQQNAVAYDCVFSDNSAILVITQMIHGRWRGLTAEDYEEVTDPDLKPVETVQEEKTKEWLKENLGISTCGFKSFFE